MGPKKAQSNERNHQVSFHRAATIFLDPNALSEFDEGHTQDEERWITVGLDHVGTLLVVSHTYRDETETSAKIRIIAARKATRKESRQYKRRSEL
jgi:uncharacterized protein